ncbi:hypothetical protein CASFOL_031042 [Castilleja foliolosa]|uniref:Uncharacterized protein n=1 Tax=Castilleja foliolosa TaxID=1961234 RepID=A0ABD3C486_9LAMI
MGASESTGFPLPRRLTRSALAKIASERKRRDETGLDAALSRRDGATPIIEISDEEMAPGVTAAKKKPKFVRNQTSINSTIRRRAIVPTEEHTESCRNESTLMPKSTEVPSKELLQTDSDVSRTQSNVRQTKSTIRQTPSAGLQTKSILSRQTPPTGVQTKSTGLQTTDTLQENHSVSPQGQSQSPSLQTPTTSHENQSVSHQGQSTNPQTQSNIPLTQTNSTHTQSNSPETQSAARQSKSKNHKKKSNGHQTQSIGRQSPSTDRQSPSTGRQSQANAPHTETFGLRDEETDIQTQSTDNTESASQDETTETEAVSSLQKRKRGPTMGRGLMKAVGGSKGKKLKIEVDPAIGRPTHRLESAKFSSQVGVVARDVLPVVRKWKEIDVKSALEPCIDHMQIHMDVNIDKPGVRQCVIERLKNSSRQQRYRLHVHYKRFPNVEEAKKNMPASVTDQSQWEQLCDYFNSPEFKNQSKANSNNRKKVQAKHITGRTPFTIIQNEISRKKGDDCGMIELYKSTHENVEGKWSSNVAQENWELMMEKKEKYAEQGIDVTPRFFDYKVSRP